MFRKVCAAVGYAHQNLVVHRDLKPANIRVTAEGEPKLLDFGIAKLLDPDTPSGRVDVTVTMSGAMTPEYASPEQLRGEPITTASDVYSLGVVLYELLTGRLPYQVKGRRPDELARAICEEEPPRASTVAGRVLTASPAGPAATALTVPVTLGGETPARLRRRLEGDLDNIVAMALRKEPTRRYPSAPQFSEDIRRHCEGLPVSARKDTLRYRTDKFVRRNKTGVAAAAFVVLALVTGLALAIWQAHVARQALGRTLLAQKQEERLNSFLQTLLGSANPENGPGRDLKVIQVLDRASANLDHELAGEPDLLAQAHLTIGQAYSGLKETEQALTHLQMALALNRRAYGEDHILTARSKAALGVAINYLQRDIVKAEPLLREALAVERRQPPSEQSSLPTILDALSRILNGTGRFDEGNATTMELPSVARQSHGEESEAYARALEARHLWYINKGDYAGAETSMRQCIAIYRRMTSENSILAHLLGGFAYSLLLQGKTDEAAGVLRENIDLCRRTMGEDTNIYHFQIGLLALMHFERGDFPAAEREMRYASDYLLPRYPKNDEEAVGMRVVLGSSLVHLNRPAEGEPYLRDALQISQTNHFTGLMSSTAYIGAALVECLLAQKHYAEAEPLLLKSYDERKQRLGEQNPKTVQAVTRVHDLYVAWNKPVEAARYASIRTDFPAPPLSQ